jgi:outer membrane protein TolC
MSAVRSAEDFDRRTLASDGLRHFFETNHQTWPLKAWDLNALTLAGFYYHPDLDVARAKWRGAAAAITTAGERPNPSVSLSPAYDTTTPPPWILGLSFDIPIETAGKRGHRIRQAKHLLEAARLNLAATAWQVRSRVRHSLLELYAAHEIQSALKEQAEAQAKVAGFLEKQLEAGAVSPVELTQARINLSNSRLTLLDAQRQEAEARVQMADSIGVPAGAMEGIELSFGGLDQFPMELTTAEARRTAALNRTDILAALAEYAASQAALQLEIAKQYPDLHIGPGYQLDQTDNKWSLGATLTLPILNQNRGAVAEAMAHREEAAAKFVSVQAKALGEIDRAVAGYRLAREQAVTVESLLAEVRKRQETAKAMFEAGEVDALSVANAQVEFSVGALARVTSILRAQQSLAGLEDAVQSPLSLNVSAPGWEKNPREKPQTPNSKLQ